MQDNSKGRQAAFLGVQRGVLSSRHALSALVEGGDELRLLIQEFLHVHVVSRITASASLEERVRLCLLLGATQFMFDMLAYLDTGRDSERKVLLVSAYYAGRADVFEKLEIIL